MHLTEEQKVLYKELKRNAITNLQGEYMTVNNVITEIIRLHQITAGFFKGESGIIKDLDNDKMRPLIEIIEESDQKTIIWANWIYNIEQITLRSKSLVRRPSLIFMELLILKTDLRLLEDFKMILSVDSL